MKSQLTTFALIIGLVLGLGPWMLFEKPSYWWYPISVVGGLLVTIAGLGAQMEQLGQGNTGEKFLQTVFLWVKSKFKRTP